MRMRQKPFENGNSDLSSRVEEVPSRARRVGVVSCAAGRVERVWYGATEGVFGGASRVFPVPGQSPLYCPVRTKGRRRPPGVFRRWPGEPAHRGRRVAAPHAATSGCGSPGRLPAIRRAGRRGSALGGWEYVADGREGGGCAVSGGVVPALAMPDGSWIADGVLAGDISEAVKQERCGAGWFAR